MNRLVAFIIATLCLLFPASGLTRVQVPAADPSRASLEGFVVDSVTGQPIEGVHVAIVSGVNNPLSEAGVQSLLEGQRPTVQAPQITKVLPAFMTLIAERTTHSVMTDARGKFLFTALTAGNYILSVRADGYNYQVYGQKTGSPFAPPLDIHEGKNDVGAVQMSPEPRVGGKIIDATGAPIKGIPVYLLNAQPIISIDGEKRFRVVSEVSC